MSDVLGSVSGTGNCSEETAGAMATKVPAQADLQAWHLSCPASAAQCQRHNMLPALAHLRQGVMPLLLTPHPANEPSLESNRPWLAFIPSSAHSKLVLPRD